MHLRFSHQHSRFWPILTHFVDYYSPFLGPKRISIVVEPQVALTCRSSILAHLWTITHYFGVPERFPRLTNPGVRLCFGHQHSRFWPILTRFVDYYSLFWRPGVISTINEPWGAFTFRSSTLAVLADSEPFRGLLLTIFGPQINFHSC